VKDIHDVIKHAKFGDDRLRGSGVVAGQISAFPIDFVGRPYNTLTLPCERVMSVDGLSCMGMTKYRQGPTKEHYTGPHRIGNHEKAARLATVLCNL